MKALAAVCGFDALRLAAPEKGTEGIRHYSRLHGLMPRLGFFVGQEARLPFDFDEVLSLIAPRATLIVAPTLDRYAPVAALRREVGEAGKVYRLLGHESALRLEAPLDFSRFERPMQEQVLDWLEKVR